MSHAPIIAADRRRFACVLGLFGPEQKPVHASPIEGRLESGMGSPLGRDRLLRPSRLLARRKRKMWLWTREGPTRRRPGRQGAAHRRLAERGNVRPRTDPAMVAALAERQHRRARQRTKWHHRNRQRQGQRGSPRIAAGANRPHPRSQNQSTSQVARTPQTRARARRAEKSTTALGINTESNGQILLPPSMHRNGTPYEIASDLPIAEIHPELLARLQALPMENQGKPAKNGKTAKNKRHVGPLVANMLAVECPPFNAYECAKLESALRYHDAAGVWVLDPRNPSFDAWSHVLYPLAWLIRNGWPEEWVLALFIDWSAEAEGLKDEPGRDVYPGSDECERRLRHAVERGEDVANPKTTCTIYGLVHARGWKPPLPAAARDDAELGGSKARQRDWPDVPAGAPHQRPKFHTDLGNARRLIARHGSNIRFVPEWHKWIIWNSTHWRIDDDGAIARLAKDTIDSMFPEALKIDDDDKKKKLLNHAIKSQSAARLDAMVILATTEAAVVVRASQLDADSWLLGVQNGVIELRTRQFRAARHEDYITKRTGVAFNAETACPNWREFIRTITAGDEELAAYLQRVVGYTLTGSVREEVLFVPYGTGNNGKSTFRETIHMMMGDYAIVADNGLLIERKTPGAATPELARLKGCRMVSVNETSENDHLNEARVKFITSQDKITARNLYQEFFDFDPTHKTFLTTNHKPIVRGTDTGIWRRLHLLPYTVTIPTERVERDFREKRLVPELLGILNWALDGLVAYQRVGLNPPPAVRSATEYYQQDMDIVGQWIEDRCISDPQATVPTRVAYSDYVQWAQGETGWVLPRLKFRRNLTDRGFGSRKGTAGQRLILGLQLRTPAPLYMAHTARS
jgi:putative DNA primase/helicase